MDDRIQALAQQLTTEWAPAALELGVRITFYDNLGWLIRGFLFLILSIGSGFFAHRMYNYITEHGEWEQEDMPLSAIGLIAGIVVCVIAAVVAILMLSSPWAWIGVLDPRTTLAHDIYVKLVK